MKRWQQGVAAAMAALVFLSTTALTAIDAGAALKELKQVTVQQGPLRGVVVNSDGKGLVKSVIDIRDSKGEVISLGVTKADGSFCLASVPEGDYRLTVNGEFTYPLQVAKAGESGVLSLVVPDRAMYSAGAEDDDDNKKAMYIAGGVALTMLAVVLLSDSDDDCNK